jgi:hypothetical protein
MIMEWRSDCNAYSLQVIHSVVAVLCVQSFGRLHDKKWNQRGSKMTSKDGRNTDARTIQVPSGLCREQPS